MMSVEQMRQRLQQAEAIASRINKLQTDGVYAKRWEKTYEQFDYGYCMFRFICAQVDCLKALCDGKYSEAKKYLKEAESYRKNSHSQQRHGATATRNK